MARAQSQRECALSWKLAPLVILTPLLLLSCLFAWLIRYALGDEARILSLLEDDPSLLAFQDIETAQTCLHWAVLHSRYDAAILLLSKGADRNATDNDGKTFIDLARQLGAPEDILSKLRSS